MAVDEDRILIVGDALVGLIRTFLPTATDDEVKLTFFARRYDAAKSQGRKVYVVPREDEMGDQETAGTRGRDPMDYTFSIVVAERIDSNLETWDAMDAWVRVRAKFVADIRNRLKNPREYSLVSGMDLYPTATGPREVADLAELNQNGVFMSEFTNTIREV